MATAGQGRQVTPAKLPRGVDPAVVGHAIGMSFTSGVHVALWVSGIMLIVGSPIAFATIRKTAPHHVRAAALRAQKVETEARARAGKAAP
jgi:hypothetical protein